MKSFIDFTWSLSLLERLLFLPSNNSFPLNFCLFNFLISHETFCGRFSFRFFWGFSSKRKSENRRDEEAAKHTKFKARKRARLSDGFSFSRDRTLGRESFFIRRARSFENFSNDSREHYECPVSIFKRKNSKKKNERPNVNVERTEYKINYKAMR